MPFVRLETISKSNELPKASVSYRLTGNPGRQAAQKPSFVVVIPTKTGGVAKADRFVLLVGTGADSRKLRILGVQTADINYAFAIQASKCRNYTRFNFGYVPHLGEDRFDGERWEVRNVGDNEYELDVPNTWFDGAPKS